MAALQAIATAHNLIVIEDAAHGVNAACGSRALGAVGALGAWSFHETKDLVCGEGGALLIRDDEEYMQAAEILREKGTDRTAFLRGERDKYTWVGVGSSYVLSELLAAVAVEQFFKLPEVTRRKTAQAERLVAALSPYRAVVQLPSVPDGCQPNWHVFAVLVDPARRDWVITRSESRRRQRGLSLRPAALGAVRSAVVVGHRSSRSSRHRSCRGVACSSPDLAGVHRGRVRRRRDGLRQGVRATGGRRMTIGERRRHRRPASVDYGRRVLRQATGVLTARAGAVPMDDRVRSRVGQRDVRCGVACRTGLRAGSARALRSVPVRRR